MTDEGFTGMHVYVLFVFSKTWTECLGVYSKHENAKKAYDYFMSKMTGSDNRNALIMLTKILDEPLIKTKSE